MINDYDDDDCGTLYNILYYCTFMWLLLLYGASLYMRYCLKCNYI